MSTHVEQIKRNYTEEELIEFGEKLAREHQKVQQIETDKKAAMDGFKALFAESEVLIEDLSKKITLGVEVKEIECDIVYDMPLPGRKQIVRRDNLEVLRDEAMTKQEKGGALFESV